MQTPTPADLEITPRERQFGRHRSLDRWWLGGDPFATAFYNSLSVVIPKGEALFLVAVRNFSEGAPPKLAREIAAFSRQEGVHTREHLAFNRRVADAGYDLSILEAKVDQRLALLASKPPIASLAATMALEHFTAILARELLTNPRHLRGADAEAAAMWRWHSIEEIEHKGVAYDTWLHATRHWSRFRRWRLKAKVMLLVTRNFVVDRMRGMLTLLAQDGITGPRAWAEMLWVVWVRPGMMRKILTAWLAFFLPGFHPWKRDDRGLIELGWQIEQHPQAVS